MDITHLAQDAIFEIVKKSESATHFKIDSEGFYIPCEPSDTAGFPMTLDEFKESQKVKPPLVSVEDFKKIVSINKPSISKEELDKMNEFANKHG